MIKKIIIANWKMNPATFKEAETLFKKVWIYGAKKQNDLDLVIAPPFIYMESLLAKAKSLKFKVKFGAQNCFWEKQGAFTGEVSSLMLKNLGVENVIIGHSERRNYLRESDGMIAQKIKAVIENKLTPVLCVGETLEQRNKGIQKNVVQEQLKNNLREIGNLKKNNLVVAYEPIWAIGTGNYCQPAEALEMIKFIKELLNLNFGVQADEGNMKVLYGGSVDSKNIAAYIKYPEIDGALVGGASIKIKEFQGIINEVSKTARAESA